MLSTNPIQDSYLEDTTIHADYTKLVEIDTHKLFDYIKTLKILTALKMRIDATPSVPMKNEFNQLLVLIKDSENSKLYDVLNYWKKSYIKSHSLVAISSINRKYYQSIKLPSFSPEEVNNLCKFLEEYKETTIQTKLNNIVDIQTIKLCSDNTINTENAINIMKIACWFAEIINNYSNIQHTYSNQHSTDDIMSILIELYDPILKKLTASKNIELTQLFHQWDAEPFLTKKHYDIEYEDRDHYSNAYNSELNLCGMLQSYFLNTLRKLQSSPEPSIAHNTP